MTKKIAIFFWDGWLDVSPTLQYLIKKLNENDFFVDVFLKDDGEFSLESIKDYERLGVKFRRINTLNRHPLLNFYIYFLRKIKNLKFEYLNKLINKIILKLLQSIAFSRISKFIKDAASCKIEYDLIFCVDAISLYLLDKSEIQFKNIYYLSLELGETPINISERFKNEILNNEKKYFKNLISFTLIQDQYRWEALKRHIGIESNKMLELPNSTQCLNEIEKKYVNNYFYENFNLEPDTKVVLSAGMISKNVCSLEVSEAIGNFTFDSKIKVIFHDRIKQNDKSEYLKEVIFRGKENLILSLKPLQFKELYKIFASAHIGLAIYNGAVSDNYKYMVGASGKLYQYLKFGLPVITSNLPGFKEFVSNNNIGVVVDSPNEIPAAIEKIINNYKFYKQNVITIFNDELNVDIYLNKIIKQINNTLE